MNIGIDARVLEKKMTGVGRLLLEFLQHIPAADKENKYYLFSYNKLDAIDPFFTSVQTVPMGTKSKLYSPFWLVGILPHFLKKYEIDIFFTPNAFAPIRMSGSRWKSVIVIHDTFNKVQRDYHPFWYNAYLDIFMPLALRQSSAVITISENSKADIVKYYGTNPSKIHLFYRAAEARFVPRPCEDLPMERLQKITTVDGRFILYVGVIEFRKNIQTIIATADRLKSMGVPTPIVCVGRPGNGGGPLIEEMKKRDNIVYISYIEDELLPLLYNSADIFFFPSLYEGFGLPPLEAMQSGTPVVTSNASSLPEVIGDAGVMCDPFDSDGFAAAIARLLADRTFHSVMREKGIRQAEKFDSSSASVRLVELFKSLR